MRVCVSWPGLGEEVDAVGDGVHGDWVSSDEEAPEVNSGQVVEFGVEAGQLPDVVADHVKKTLGHVFFGELCSAEQRDDEGGATQSLGAEQQRLGATQRSKRWDTTNELHVFSFILMSFDAAVSH